MLSCCFLAVVFVFVGLIWICFRIVLKLGCLGGLGCWLFVHLCLVGCCVGFAFTVCDLDLFNSEVLILLTVGIDFVINDFKLCVGVFLFGLLQLNFVCSLLGGLVLLLRLVVWCVLCWWFWVFVDLLLFCWFLFGLVLLVVCCIV